MAGETVRAEPPPGPPPRDVLWRWRRNPLRRPADVVLAWTGLVLLLTVLAGVPAAALWAGDTALRHYRESAERQARTHHLTTAVLLRDAPRHPEPGSAEARETRYPVTVRYTPPDGRPRTARTEVVPGLRAGSTVRVRVGPDGRLGEPPPDSGEIRSRAAGWALLAAMGVAAAGAAAYRVAGRALERRNLARWDAAWAAAARSWTISP
ncbi:hypothetical protein [Streptomyces sp. NPDC006134]|uniref:Rv1733c family protein n=1 Tax=Streptomyces sp. NPDC006134 TaxID=3154467 RepID=UPI0033DE20FF